MMAPEDPRAAFAASAEARRAYTARDAVPKCSPVRSLSSELTARARAPCCNEVAALCAERGLACCAASPGQLDNNTCYA
jgi:hypothetical protein